MMEPTVVGNAALPHRLPARHGPKFVLVEGQSREQDMSEPRPPQPPMLWRGRVSSQRPCR